jgi:putative restriction endonuclease
MDDSKAVMPPSDSLDEWLARVGRLRVDRSHDVPAPHKPLLLMSVMDLVRDGVIARPFVELSTELIEVFNTYWEAWSEGRSRGLVALPFFHLRSEGFWQLVPLSGMEEALRSAESISSVVRLRQMIIGASIDAALWALMQEPGPRETMRQTLLRTYFARPEMDRLVHAERQMAEVAAARRELLGRADHEFRLREPRPRQTNEVVRTAAFRSAIVGLYDHTCAICGLRLITPQGLSALEAAHIVPFSESHNDDPRNGLGLCKLHHWCFDQGLVSVADDLTILTSPILDPRRPTEDRLTELEAKPILPPHDAAYLPSNEALEWHRSNVLLQPDQ